MILADGSHVLHRMKYVADEANWKFYAFLFVRSMLATMKKFEDREVVIIWDYKGSKRKNYVHGSNNYKQREELDPSNSDHIEKIKQLEAYTLARKWLMENLSQMGILSIFSEGIEADDIAYYISNCKFTDSSKQITLVTEDNDWFQSLNEHTQLYRPILDRMVLWEDFRDSWNLMKDISPQDMFCMVKAVKGDGSDGIEGVNGVGEVWGRKFIMTYLCKEGFNLGRKKDISFLEAIESGKLQKNIELISFKSMTCQEQHEVDKVWDPLYEAWDVSNNPDLMDWIDLANQLDSTRMVDFGDYYEGW